MNEDIDFLADEIRKYYQMQRSGILGENVFTPTSAKYNEAFKKSAVICARLGAEPEMYVKAQFAFIDNNKLLVAPDLLHIESESSANKAEHNYKRFIEGMTLSLQQSYDLQLSYLQDQITLVHRPINRALMDDFLNFKPWFRVCITKEPIPEVVEKYKEEAKKEYLNSHKLREFMATKKFDHTRFI